MLHQATPSMVWEFVLDLDFFIGIVLGATAILCLTWTRRQHLSHGMLTAVRNERRRLARELHDTVGHGLVLIAMNARRLPRVAARTQPVAEAIDEAVHMTMNDVRRLVGELRGDENHGDTPWTDSSLPGIITDLGVRAAGANFAVSLENAGAEHHLHAELRKTAFRVVQEGLTNAVKHGPGPVHASLRFSDELLLCVASGDTFAHDDVHIVPVTPFRVSSLDQHYGLLGLAERVNQAGGTFECGTSATGGFLIRARIPLGESGARQEGRDKWMKSAS